MKIDKMSQKDFDKAQAKLGVAPVASPNKGGGAGGPVRLAGGPAWLMLPDGSNRKYPDYDSAKSAGMRAYAKDAAKGIDPKDSYFVMHQGVAYGVHEMMPK